LLDRTLDKSLLESIFGGFDSRKFWTYSSISLKFFKIPKLGRGLGLRGTKFELLLPSSLLVTLTKLFLIEAYYIIGILLILINGSSDYYFTVFVSNSYFFYYF
jgi:hypothetical protein